MSVSASYDARVYEVDVLILNCFLIYVYARTWLGTKVTRIDNFKNNSDPKNEHSAISGIEQKIRGVQTNKQGRSILLVQQSTSEGKVACTMLEAFATT